MPVSQKLVSVCSWHFCIPSPIIYKVMHFASSKHLAPCNYECMQWHFILSCANSKIHHNRKAHSRNSVIWNERIKNVRHGRIRFLIELSLFVQCSSVIFVCYKNGVLILFWFLYHYFQTVTLAHLSSQVWKILVWLSPEKWVSGFQDRVWK